MSGGGGGSSGQVDYPEYMKYMHEEWLLDVNADIQQVRGTGPFVGASAYNPAPEVNQIVFAKVGLENMVDAVHEVYTWNTIIENARTEILSHLGESLPGATIPDTNVSLITMSPRTFTPVAPVPAAQADIDDDVNAFADLVDAQLLSDVYPRFEGGMRDINAVMSSAFIIGRALIEDGRNREVTKYATNLRLQAFLQKDKILADHTANANRINADMTRSANEFDLALIRQDNEAQIRLTEQSNKILSDEARHNSTILSTEAMSLNSATMEACDQMLKTLNYRLEYERVVASLDIEAGRMSLVAHKEQRDQDIKIDEAFWLWDLQAWKYGANILSSIAGGSMGDVRSSPSTAQSAVGGALSGAAAGAMMGASMTAPAPYVGAAIGGILGAASAFL